MFLIKRIIDIILSLIGCLFVLPFFPIIALLIKLDSKGPVFYLANRVGKDMEIFKMYKFRTMLDSPLEAGQSLTPQYDPRVTTFGRFLRRTKLNELPQFLNILRGEMTFVGPRPEAPDLAELYPEEAKRVFSVKPGLVGPNVIYGRNEEEFFPPGVDAKIFYIEKILPRKSQLDLEYIDHPSLFKDFKYIFLGAKETLMGSLAKRHIQDNRSQLYLLIADIFLILTSFIFANVIVFWDFPVDSVLIRALWNLPLVIIIRLLCNNLLGLYKIIIRYISYQDIFRVLKAISFGSLVLFLLGYIFGLECYSILIVLFDGLCLIYLLGGVRFLLLFRSERKSRKAKTLKKHRILIYGAGDAGNTAYRALANREGTPFEIVGFLDDAPDKYGKTLNGVRVLGNRYHINALARLYGIQEILISEPGEDLDHLTEIIRICQQARLRYRFFSSISDLDSRSKKSFPVRNVQLSDALHLKRIHADQASVKSILRDKTILMNGAGGALGLELCRKVLQLGSRRLIIFDRYESYLNELASDLLADFSTERIVPVLNIPTEADTLRQVFMKYRPNIVFHAGMRKYVPLLGLDLGDIGRINYLHTFHLAKTAADFRCEIFVMISSLLADKNENGNLITDSLRIAEVSLEHFFSDTYTHLIIPRICDIIENRGGIVAILEDRLKDQKLFSLPSEDLQVSLLSKDSASEFILQSLVEAQKCSYGRSIFTCDPGPPLPILELVRKLVAFYGFEMKFDLDFQKGTQGNKLISQSINPLSSSDPHYATGIDPPEDRVFISHGEIKSVFKNFVLGKNGDSSIQDWRIRTQELTRLYKQGLRGPQGMPP